MTFLLDSSAWLAHLFGESGAEQVNLLFDEPNNEVSISALSIPEVYGRLKALRSSRVGLKSGRFMQRCLPIFCQLMKLSRIGP